MANTPQLRQAISRFRQRREEAKNPLPPEEYFQYAIVRPKSDGKRERVQEMEGLRGLLAVWVLFSHVFCWCGYAELQSHNHALAFVWNIFIAGTTPVEVFMILSGFAISFLINARPQSYSEFITHRFFRIYPVYITCLLLGLVVTFLIPYVLQNASWRSVGYFDYTRAHLMEEVARPSAHILAHLTLLNGLIPNQILRDSTGTFLPPAWSITLEWQYYLVAPIVALLVRSGTGIVVLTVGAYIASRLSAPWQNPFLAFLPAQLPLFMLGIASYHLFTWFSTSRQLRASHFAIPAAALLGVGVLSYPWHTAPLVIWALAFGSVFVRNGDLFSGSLTFVRGFLLHPVLQVFGKISYPLYLVHWPLILVFLYGFLHVWPSLTSGHALLLEMFVATPIILAAAVLLHLYVEAPGMAFGKRFWASRRAASKFRTSPAVAEAS